MFFELPWVGGAQEDAMAVAIHIKYLVGQKRHITSYSRSCRAYNNFKITTVRGSFSCHFYPRQLRGI